MIDYTYLPEIVQEYRNGVSVKQLAEMLDVPELDVIFALGKAGIRMNKAQSGD